jgi:flagellar biosynthesis protein
MASKEVVTPVKTGVQPFRNCTKTLDSGFRRNDGLSRCWTFAGASHSRNQKAPIMPDTPPKKKAVALRYDTTQDAAPKMIAKGAGEVAEKIIALAKEYGIPIQEDADLVEILAKLDLNADIPPETYLVVAEILAFIYRANSKMTPA